MEFCHVAEQAYEWAVGFGYFWIKVKVQMFEKKVQKVTVQNV